VSGIKSAPMNPQLDPVTLSRNMQAFYVENQTRFSTASKALRDASGQTKDKALAKELLSISKKYDTLRLESQNLAQYATRINPPTVAKLTLGNTYYSHFLTRVNGAATSQFQALTPSLIQKCGSI